MGGISDRKTHFDRHILRYEPYNPLQVQRSIVLSNEEGPKPHSLWLSQLVLLALRPARGSPARGGGVSPRGVRVGPKDCASAELAPHHGEPSPRNPCGQSESEKSSLRVSDTAWTPESV